ncbi:hypothetical protein [Trichocoleus desertorum]
MSVITKGCCKFALNFSLSDRNGSGRGKKWGGVTLEPTKGDLHY